MSARASGCPASDAGPQGFASMCQLLGFNRAQNAARPLPDFDEFALRGGQTDAHADGWGIARRLRPNNEAPARWDIQHGVEPGFQGPVADLLRQSLDNADAVAIAHLRRATIGHNDLLNQHPFSRRIWNQTWVFAHNGHLRGLERHLPAFCAETLPRGATDSEAAFCWLIAALKARFGAKPATPEAFFKAIAHWHEQAENLGSANSLLSDGSRLFAHCTTKLSMAQLDGAVVFATEPVGEAPWVALKPGQSVWAENGRVAAVKDRDEGAPPLFDLPPTIGAASLAASEALDALIAKRLAAQGSPALVATTSSSALPPLAEAA